MERAFLAIIVLVFMVGAVGFFTVLPRTTFGIRIASADVNSAGTATAAPDVCASCKGSPVCAGKEGKAINYVNACEAKCDNARILLDGVCEKIRTAQQIS